MSYTPKVPPEHDQDRKSEHTGQGELRDVHNLWCVMTPWFLKCFMMVIEDSKIQGPLTSESPSVSPSIGKPLYTKKTVEMNRYILCIFFQ